MKALPLLKQNIEALLRARHQDQKDLAQWCRRTEAWLSAALSKEERGIPVKYLDRIADFFGLATYQLFQPGITPLTERRSKVSRRSGHDRRISNLRVVADATPHLMVSLEPEEVARVQRLRLLSETDRQKVDDLLREVLRRPGKGGGPSRGSSASGES
jgi:hypothetical protein